MDRKWTRFRTGLWRTCPTDDKIVERLEQITLNPQDGLLRFDANFFLHGSCGVFALALHDIFGYRLGWLLDDEYNSKDSDDLYASDPYMHIVHIFCVAETPEYGALFVDVRGMVDNAEMFFREFEDFFEPPVRKPPYSPTEEDLRNWMGLEAGSKTLEQFYRWAREMILRHPDWYKI